MPLFKSNTVAEQPKMATHPPPVFVSTSHPAYSSRSLSSSAASPNGRAEETSKQSDDSSSIPGMVKPQHSHSNSLSSPHSASSPASPSSSSSSAVAAPDRTNIFQIEPVISSTPRYGRLYSDSEYFDDRNFLAELSTFSHLVEIRVWSREFVHGLQAVYEIEMPKGRFTGEKDGRHIKAMGMVGRSRSRMLMETPIRRGNIHTDEYIMKVDHKGGEFIIGLEGYYKEWIECLIITTNKRKHIFGTIVHSPSHHHFSVDCPMGSRVVGFHGSYGVHLHNIGAFVQPVSREDFPNKKW